MRSIRTAILVSLFPILGCTTVAPAPKAAAVVPVTVAIDSRPDFAEVSIDGKFVGTTPLAQRLLPGAHTIEISREKYQTWKRELAVTAGNPTRVTAVLREGQ